MAMALSVTKAVAMLVSMLVLSFTIPSLAISISSFTKLPLPPQVMGPEAFAFDLQGQGPYTGVLDGRTLKYQGPSLGFLDYAFDSPNRSKAACDGNTNPSAFGGICGRPLGIGFQYTGELYIADANLGLLVASTNGRLARAVASSAEGQPFKFLDGLDIYPLTKTVFLTDASSRFNFSELAQAVAANDSTGRFIKYEPNINTTTVLLRNLSAPAGVAVSLDGSFVLVTEYLANRVLKYWLKGPKANTSEALVTFQGRPDNIKRNPLGDFWVAVNVQETPTAPIVPTAVKINYSGKILASFPLSDQYNTTTISEVNEYDGNLYIGSLETKFVGKYRIM
ncbi:hypothetical protein JCGZ_05819 [Jatropha curcas]|uniref:JHL10I11.5 protein n=1 Tax=Jatropha curcas TaxID=180498 RepID=E6NU49_JATCU|nr:protein STRICTOSIDINE SYNTHASE-LIKE 11 [Jatropha curcas]KDP20050.1 hypothetical protein JCGZ_05819 [Jatropha curcas]BAJ53159.1 JHL10I11.5 [Jatropha curcas]